MSEQTSKELADMERFAPSFAEKINARERLMIEWFLESEGLGAAEARAVAASRTRADLHEWIAEETQRRIEADSLANLP